MPVLLAPSAPSAPPLAALGLGSSLGDREALLRLAVAALDHEPGLEVLRVSRSWRSPPLGGVARGCFLNAVALLRCDLAPEALLFACKAVERRLGRRPSRRWGDRAVDLDLLLVGDAIRERPGFVLPHPGIRARPFVLHPLLEVWPEAWDPRTRTPYAEAPGRHPGGLVPGGILTARTPAVRWP